MLYCEFLKKRFGRVKRELRTFADNNFKYFLFSRKSTHFYNKHPR